MDLDQLHGPDASIPVHPTNVDDEMAAEWYIESGPDGLTWRRGHERAAVARGPLTDLLNVFYRRQPPDGSPGDVIPPLRLLDLWLKRVDMG